MSVDELGATPPPGTRGQGAAGPGVSRRRGRRLLAAGSAAAAVALAAGLTFALRGGPAAPSPPPAPSPLSVVTRALARTSAQSYTFRVATIVRLPKKVLNAALVSGAYDPRHHLGTEQLTARAAGQTRRAQVRFIGPYLYTSVSPASGFAEPWDRTPIAAATATRMPPGDVYGFTSDQAVSPAELTVVLRSEGAAVHDEGPVSGPGWTGTRYSFSARPRGRHETVSGTVEVDRQGRVRLLATTTGEGGTAGGKAFFTTSRAVRFGGFGVPVRAIPPPASQVKVTAGTPYWGFYF